MITAISHHLVILSILSYLVCGVATERRFASWFVYVIEDEEPGFAIFIGVLSGLFWPIAIVCYLCVLLGRLVRWLSSYHLPRKLFFAEPKAKWDLNSSGRRRLEDAKRK